MHGAGQLSSGGMNSLASLRLTDWIRVAGWYFVDHLRFTYVKGITGVTQDLQPATITADPEMHLQACHPVSSN